MFNKIKAQKGQSGFTIIEVIIVLAIAGLIMAVVFLAVPALQRSQRNNARRSDASRVATQVIDFSSNSPTNSLPATVADCGTVKDAAATLSQYNSIAAGDCTAAGTALPVAVAANSMYIEVMAGAGSGLAAATTNVMVLATNSTCNANNTTTFSSNKASLLYTVEKGASWNWVCLNVQ